MGNTACRPGRADDAARADGADVLSFEQAKAKAHAMVASPNGNGNGPIVRLTVRQAMHRYISSAAATCTFSQRSATSWSAI